MKHDYADFLFRVGPFIVAGAASFALLPIQGEIDHESLFFATIMAVLFLIATVAVRRPGVALGWRVVPPLMALVIVALLHDAGGGKDSGYAAFFLLPVIWIALYGSRRSLVIMLITMAMLMILPIIFIGGVRYPTAEWRAAIIVVGLGIFVGFVTQRLITDREKRRAEATKREEYITAVTESVSEGIVTLDDDGNARYVNAAAAKLLGYERHELVGRKIDALVQRTKSDGAAHPGAEGSLRLVAATGGAPVPTEDVFWRRDGTSFPVEYLSLPIISAGVMAGSVLSFSDITERKEIARLKDEFISIVGHELRTPLTSIRGSLGLMAGGVFGALSPKADRMLDIAISNTDRLVKLVNDMLDVERMAAGKSPLERSLVGAGELVSRAVDLMAGGSADAGVALVAQTDEATINVDADRLVQVLTNLISNALKFSTRGETVTVRARAQEGSVRFEVQDHGRGIPPDKLAAVFERFEQIDASDARERGGSGLGLPIAQGIVRQHGSQISVDSELGRGSRFYFDLPTASVTPAIKELTILLCSHDAAFRERVAGALRATGWHVFEASDTTTTRQVALAQHPSLVLIDPALPPDGAWRAVEALRSEPSLAETPLLIATEDCLTNRVLAGQISTIEATLTDAMVGDAPTSVLIVEDDANLATVLQAMLTERGIGVVIAPTLALAAQHLQTNDPELIVLDLGLPDGDGADLVARLRDEGRLGRITVLVYTARDVGPQERDRLRGTEVLIKSAVSPAELEGRIISIVAQAAAGPATHTASGA